MTRSQKTTSKVSVELPNSLRDFVEELVESGDYSSVNEVIADGIRMLRAETWGEGELTPDGEAKVLAGIEQARRGQLLDGQKVMKSLLARARRAAAASKPKRRAG